MKNKLIKVLMVLLGVIYTSQASYAVKITPEMEIVASKFGFAMCGVAAFSLILYIGLSLYNKFFVSEQIKDFNLRKDSLRTPADKDEAVMMFIAKNRLR